MFLFIYLHIRRNCGWFRLHLWALKRYWSLFLPSLRFQISCFRNFHMHVVMFVVILRGINKIELRNNRLFDYYFLQHSVAVLVTATVLRSTMFRWSMCVCGILLKKFSSITLFIWPACVKLSTWQNIGL